MLKVKVKIDESAYSQNCIKIPFGTKEKWLHKTIDGHW